MCLHDFVSHHLPGSGHNFITTTVNLKLKLARKNHNFSKRHIVKSTLSLSQISE